MTFCNDTGVYAYPLVRVMPFTARVCVVLQEYVGVGAPAEGRASPQAEAATAPQHPPR